MGELQTNGQDRYRAQLPRLSAQPGTALALIIQFFENSPLELKAVVPELIHNAYFIRAMKYAKDEATEELGDLIKSEALKNIWYFWGVIESICVAADIEPTELLERLTSRSNPPKASVSSSEDLSKIKVSQFAQLIQDLGSDSENIAQSNKSSNSDSTDLERAEERERVDSISSIFS